MNIILSLTGVSLNLPSQPRRSVKYQYDHVTVTFYYGSNPKARTEVINHFWRKVQPAKVPLLEEPKQQSSIHHSSFLCFSFVTHTSAPGQRNPRNSTRQKGQSISSSTLCTFHLIHLLIIAHRVFLDTIGSQSTRSGTRFCCSSRPLTTFAPETRGASGASKLLASLPPATQIPTCA